MCGVIKSPVAGTIATTQLCGVAKLNAYGCCVVLLPPEFPDPGTSGMVPFDEVKIGNKSDAETSSPYAPFTVSYNLTPLGACMPGLHISTEVTRFSSSVWKSMGVSTNVSTLSGGIHINSEKEKKSAENGIYDNSRSQNSSSSCVRGVSSKDTERNPTEINKVKTNVTVKRKKGTPRFKTEKINEVNNSSELEKEEELERIFLRNYWATNTKNLNSSSFSSVSVLGKMSRSVSTGNIPALYSSPLRYAKSTGNFLNLHNDRLIDGPLPLLGRLGGIPSTDICQLARDESDESDNDHNSNHNNNHNNNHYDNNYSNDINNYHENERDKTDSKEVGKKQEHASLPSSNSQPRTVTTNPKNIQKSIQKNVPHHSDEKKFPSGIIPLCFTISGGVPSGRVSWMITSLPQENSSSCVLSGKHGGGGTEGESHDSYSETGFQTPGDAGISGDWRAL